MIHYKDFSQGYLTYHCDYCDKIVNTRLSCNSRFCPSCGNRYRDERALSISKKVIAKPHRQFVFSMAYPLRKYCAIHEDRDALLDILFQAVEFAFESVIQKSKIAKKENRQFGYILFLHTYRRSINWHPHIHALVCEGYMDNKNKYHKFDYFHYDRLRLSFMYELHNLMYIYFKEHKSKEEADDFYTLTEKLKNKYKKVVDKPQPNYLKGRKIKMIYFGKVSSIKST